MSGFQNYEFTRPTIIVSHNQLSLIKFGSIHSTIFTAATCESGTVLGTRDPAVSRAVLPLALAEEMEKQLEWPHRTPPTLFS